MAGEKQDGDTGTPAAKENSGAGYGNNALADDVGQAGEEEADAPSETDE